MNKSGNVYCNASLLKLIFHDPRFFYMIYILEMSHKTVYFHSRLLCWRKIKSIRNARDTMI